MPITWNDTADRKLLLNIINLTAPQHPNWQDVASAMGEGYTPEAVRQRFFKMRRATAKDAGEPDRTTKATPKRAPKTKTGEAAAADDEETSTKLTTRKRKGCKTAKAEADADGDDDESPKKKQAVKAESDDE